MRRWAVVVVLCQIAVASVAVPARADHNLTPQPTGVTSRRLVSIDSSGATANADTQHPEISGNGRLVLFASTATNLVGGTQNNKLHVYAHDLWTRQTHRVSESVNGPANANANVQDVSTDATRLLYTSAASNLVPDDNNNVSDLFLFDAESGETRMVSVNSAGAAVDKGAGLGSLSGDGRHVVFESSSQGMVGPTSPVNVTNIYYHDTVTGTTSRVTNGDGDGANGSSSFPDVSEDGSVIAFTTTASDLGTIDTNGRHDVYVFDGTSFSRIAGPSSSPQGGASSVRISADGNTVAFASSATDIVPGDTNELIDVFVYVRSTGTYERYAIPGAGPTSGVSMVIDDISADGRYLIVETNESLVSGDTDTRRMDLYRLDRTNGTYTLLTAGDGSFSSSEWTTTNGAADDSGNLVAFHSHLSFETGSLPRWQTYVTGDLRIPRHITRRASDLFGRPRSAFYPGDPVNSATGNFVDAATDLAFPEHVFGMSMERAYNSLDSSAGVLGVGWSHPFDVRLEEAENGDVTYRAPDGRRVVFESSGAGYADPLEFRGTLASTSTGWQLTHDDGVVDDFDEDGRPLSRTAPDGQVVTYEWTAGQLSSAESSLGFTLTPGYDAGRMTTLSTSDGRTVTYEYTGAGALRRVSVDGVGQQWRYEHDASGRVSAVRNGADAILLSNTYDAFGRVLIQSSTQGGVVSFAYDDFYGLTTVTWAASGQSVSFQHDEDGRVTQVTDPLGEVSERTYDADGNLVGGTERGGGELQQTFDAAGNLLTRTEPDGGTHTWTYDSANRTTAYTDPTNATTTYGYTGDSRVPSSVTDPEGGVTSITETDGLVTAVEDADGYESVFTYDAAGNLTSVTDPASKTTTMTYDGGGRLLTATTPLGSTSTNAYDDGGRLLTSTDAAGKTTTYSYDAAGLLWKVIDPIGATRTFTYTVTGSPLTETDPNGKVTTYEYDTSERLKKVIRPGNAQTVIAPGPLDRVASVTSPVAVATSYTYDTEGNVLTETTPAGVTSHTYDDQGRRLTTTDPLNRTTTYTYDAMGRLLSVTDPDSETVTYEYDANGRLTRQETALGNETFWRYTPGGRLDELENGVSAITSYAYDSAGRLSTVTSPEGGVTTYAYDHDGRLTATTTPAGLVTTTTYDAMGRSLVTTGPAGEMTVRTYTARGELATLLEPGLAAKQFTYDLVGRLTKAIAPNGGQTLYGYDDRGNLTTRTNSNAGIDTWTYDAADRVTSWKDPLNKITTYTYDTSGRLHVVTDPTARTTTHGYDAASQLLSKTYGDGSSDSYSYDLAGRRVDMTNAGGTTSWDWDADGRLVEVTHPDSTTLDYAYDAADRRTGVTYTDGSSTAYTYDGDGRLTQMTHPAMTGPIAYTHDADGRVLTETQPGVARAWTYDDGRLVAYQDTRGGSTRSWLLTRDPAGRVIVDTDSNGTAGRYRYDTAGQLVEATQRGPLLAKSMKYTYDLSGNRTTESANDLIHTQHSYDVANRLTESVTHVVGVATGARTQYGNDHAGRRFGQSTSDLAGNPLGGIAWTYDAAGRVSKQETLDDTFATTLTDQRTHDPDGRLIRVDITPTGAPTETTDFRWDPTQDVEQILELDRAGAASRLLYGADRAVAVQATGAQPFLHDAYGSALATAGTSTLVRADGYDAFGLPAGKTSAEPAFGYRGELHVSGNVHLRARDYDPATGRFMSKDPLDGVAGEVLAANPYPYAANDPLNMIDPTGERPFNDTAYRLLVGYRTPTGWTTMPPRSWRTPSPQFSYGSPRSTDRGFWQGAGRAGWGLVTGTVNTVLHPGILVDTARSAYRDSGGGAHGALAAINQFNPAYHAITAGDACINAYHAGHRNTMGYECTNTVIDTLGAITLAGGAARGLARTSPAPAPPVRKSAISPPSEGPYLSSLSTKIQRQMGPRGWTTELIEEAMQQGRRYPAVNKLGGVNAPATRYVHPRTGQSVVVDNATGEVIHVGGPGFRY